MARADVVRIHDKPKRRKSIVNTMLLDCGLRVSELSGLDMDDINWADGTLIVLGRGRKERVVPFDSAARHAAILARPRAPRRSLRLGV
jgi:site-specific recombinase XerC